MDTSIERSFIVSVSRTKDMVHRSPDLLAGILSGQKECRWGPYGPFDVISPEQIHTIVLWTKNPGNILQHDCLKETLIRLKQDYGVQLSLQLTVTGFGGSFIELGMPNTREVLASVHNLLNSGLIDPETVVYRYDPFLSIRTPGGNIISNVNLQLFSRITRWMIEHGIRRVVTSRADVVRYPKVLSRLLPFGLQWLAIKDGEAVKFCKQMAEYVHSRGADFSVCCEPQAGELAIKWGCIDSRWLNRIKGDQTKPATEKLHNEIGKQRPACRCTYSRDIGYSAGSVTCYSGGFGCLYCYSQGSANLPNIQKIKSEIAEFDCDPRRYLSSRDLPVELFSGE